MRNNKLFKVQKVRIQIMKTARKSANMKVKNGWEKVCLQICPQGMPYCFWLQIF